MTKDTKKRKSKQNYIIFQNSETSKCKKQKQTFNFYELQFES